MVKVLKLEFSLLECIEELFITLTFNMSFVTITALYLVNVKDRTSLKDNILLSHHSVNDAKLNLD